MVDKVLEEERTLPELKAVLLASFPSVTVGVVDGAEIKVAPFVVDDMLATPVGKRLQTLWDSVEWFLRVPAGDSDEPDAINAMIDGALYLSEEVR